LERGVSKEEETKTWGIFFGLDGGGKGVGEAHMVTRASSDQETSMMGSREFTNAAGALLREKKGKMSGNNEKTPELSRVNHMSAVWSGLYGRA